MFVVLDFERRFYGASETGKRCWAEVAPIPSVVTIALNTLLSDRRTGIER